MDAVQIQTIVHTAGKNDSVSASLESLLAGGSLGATHGVLNGTSDGSLSGELLSDHAVTAERAANCFADAADCTLLCFPVRCVFFFFFSWLRPGSKLTGELLANGAMGVKGLWLIDAESGICARGNGSDLAAC